MWWWKKKKLKSEDADKRQSAVESLGAADIDSLIEALDDSDNDVRKSAMEQLGKLGDSKAVPALVKRAETEYSDNRMLAIQTLKIIGTDEAMQGIVECLILKRGWAYYDARDTLEQIKGWESTPGARKAIPLLVEALDHEDYSTRSNAGEALGQMGVKEAKPRLLEHLQDKESSVRGAAAMSLAELGDDDVIDSIIPLLQDEDVYPRKFAASALHTLGWKPETAIDRVRLAMGRGEWDALIEMKKEALPLLIEALDDPVVDWGITAVHGLRHLGDPKAIEPLVMCLAHQFNQVRKPAARALKGINADWNKTPAAKKGVKALVKILKDKNYEDGEREVRALFKVGSPDAMKHLEAMADDPKSEANYIAGVVLDRDTRPTKKERKAAEVAEAAPRETGIASCEKCGSTLHPERVVAGEQPKLAIVTPGERMPLQCTSCNYISCHLCQVEENINEVVQRVSKTCPKCQGQLNIMTMSA